MESPEASTAARKRASSLRLNKPPLRARIESPAQTSTPPARAPSKYGKTDIICSSSMISLGDELRERRTHGKNGRSRAPHHCCVSHSLKPVSARRGNPEGRLAAAGQLA